MAARAFLGRLLGTYRTPLVGALADLPDDVLTHVAFWAAGGQPSPLPEDDPQWSASTRHAVHRLRHAAKHYLERPF